MADRFEEHLWADDHNTWVGLNDTVENGREALEIIIDTEPKQTSIVLNERAVRRLRLALQHWEKR